jgi:hypothetical protein
VQNDFSYSRGTRTFTRDGQRQQQPKKTSEKSEKKKRVHLVLRPWQHLVNSSADIYFKPKKIKIWTWQQNRFAPYLIVRLFSSRSNMFWFSFWYMDIIFDVGKLYRVRFERKTKFQIVKLCRQRVIRRVDVMANK